MSRARSVTLSARLAGRCGQVGLDSFSWHDLRHFYHRHEAPLDGEDERVDGACLVRDHSDRYGQLLEPDYGMSAFEPSMDGDDANVMLLRPRRAV